MVLKISISYKSDGNFGYITGFEGISEHLKEKVKSYLFASFNGKCKN
jgi:hypothetical protein